MRGRRTISKRLRIICAGVLLLALFVVAQVREMNSTSRWIARLCLIPEPPSGEMKFCQYGELTGVRYEPGQGPSREAVVQALNGKGQEATERLMKLARGQGVDGEVTEIARLASLELEPAFAERIRKRIDNLISGGSIQVLDREILSEADIRTAAFYALLDAKADARIVLPYLEKDLVSMEPLTRGRALVFLGVIGKNFELAEPALVRGLVDVDVANREAAALAVHRCGLVTKPIIGSLALAAEKARGFDRWAIVEALGNMGPAAKSAMPVLEEALKQETDMVLRYLVADAMARIEPTNAEAKMVLVEIAKDDSFGGLAKTSLRLVREQ